MYCKDCLFWKRDFENIGSCSNNKFIDISKDNDEEHKGDELLYSDKEGYKAYFYVGENFGCIHFKEG